MDSKLTLKLLDATRDTAELVLDVFSGDCPNLVGVNMTEHVRGYLGLIGKAGCYFRKYFDGW
ncbi:uncharacterized protein PHALS_15236 [Plasmopara halstedii]|uniref:Uncharacterized protein n=1 Tax=Plasmopara halstedii TaxID=4781 RepID=A0A0N7L8G2_PLAHL|nr:uncharacterized protein PHALS_15236 [Plasmopara halstedii]CEG49787.1 hypothetical protein PHALS_15236 [Plasmopara halstedii]|eukprot:XP_024586156.1 hypothetical protein PHALS_15236 [Plasmopara halstedii]